MNRSNAESCEYDWLNDLISLVSTDHFIGVFQLPHRSCSTVWGRVSMPKPLCHVPCLQVCTLLSHPWCVGAVLPLVVYSLYFKRSYVLCYGIFVLHPIIIITVSVAKFSVINSICFRLSILVIFTATIWAILQSPDTCKWSSHKVILALRLQSMWNKFNKMYSKCPFDVTLLAWSVYSLFRLVECVGICFLSSCM